MEIVTTGLVVVEVLHMMILRIVGVMEETAEAVAERLLVIMERVVVLV
jgi:hypothetical protein